MTHLIDTQLIGPAISPAARAAMAKYLENGFKIVQRNAMKNQNDVIALNLESPITSLIQDTDKFAKTSGGTKMYEKIVKDAQSGMFNTEAKIAAYLKKTKPPTCFVAGTLVWTDKGKVPIEQLKVGDMVLSKHENNTGEQSYKPVTRTFVHEDEVICLLQAWSKTVPNTTPRGSWEGGPTVERFKKYGEWKHFIGATPNHPFYEGEASDVAVRRSIIPNGGWIELQRVGMENSASLQLVDGSVVSTSVAHGVWKTDEDEELIVWVIEDKSEDGYPFSIHPEGFGEIHRRAFDAYPGRMPLMPVDYTPMRTTVYNIEVADFHTYYVGEMGFWVHNKNDPFDNRVLAEVQAKVLKGDDAGRIFYVIEQRE